MAGRQDGPLAEPPAATYGGRRALITEDLVKALPLSNLTIRDTKLVGFVVRCRPFGPAHVPPPSSSRGRHSVRLGSVGKLTAAQAREAARRKLAEVELGAETGRGTSRHEGRAHARPVPRPHVHGLAPD